MKKFVFSFVLVVLLTIGFTYLPLYTIAYATCPTATDTGVYHDPSHPGKCDSASGVIGLDTIGLTYSCVLSSCPDVNNPQNDTPASGHTCVYVNASDGTCTAGFGAYGFNPTNPGCKYDPADNGQHVPCPKKMTFGIQINGVTSANNDITFHVTDAGWGYTIPNRNLTFANGTETTTWDSFSGNHYTITPQSAAYTFSPPSISATTNTTWGCGVPGKTCVFTATPIGTTTSSPTGTVTPPVNGPTASISLVVGFPGIGYNAIGGVEPKHLTRPVRIELYDASVTNPSGPGTTVLGSGMGTITYDATSDNNAGYFVGTITNITLPSTPPANNQYKVLVKIPQYLYTLAVNTDGTNIFTITSGTTVTSQQFTIYAGDIATTGGGQNKLNLDDWNVIISCYGGNATTSQCPVKPANSSDLNPADLDDDGVVDIVDLNIWLRSVYQLQQLQPSPCVGDTCTGF